MISQHRNVLIDNAQEHIGCGISFPDLEYWRDCLIQCFFCRYCCLTCSLLSALTWTARLIRKQTTSPPARYNSTLINRPIVKIPTDEILNLTVLSGRIFMTVLREITSEIMVHKDWDVFNDIPDSWGRESGSFCFLRVDYNLVTGFTICTIMHDGISNIQPVVRGSSSAVFLPPTLWPENCFRC